MKKKDKGLQYHIDPPVQAYFGQPDDVFDMINQYGTYEIQRTADTQNYFPAIAQGLPKAWEAQRIDKKAAEKEARDKGFQM